MKINASTVQMASEYTALEGERIQVASRQLVRSQGSRSLNNRPQGSRDGVAGGEVRDSVSLQSRTAGQKKSTYAYAMYGDSQVSQADGNLSDENVSDASDRLTMVQRLVSGAVGREVTLTNFEEKTGGQPLASDQGSAMTGPGSLDTFAWVRETRIHFEQERVGFSALGQVETSDGRSIDFQLDLSMNRTETTITQQEALIRSRPVAMTDPLVISLDGKPPQLTDTRFDFDLDADGRSEQISFVGKGSGFLAFDKNNDGRINDGSELFGPNTGDGFADLSVYDRDQNGWIDENDAVFDQLSVWTRDSQGRDNLVSLKEAGIGAIYLGSAATPMNLKAADGTVNGQVAASGVFLFENGGVGAIQEINLAVGQEKAASPVLKGARSSFNPWDSMAVSDWWKRRNDSGKDPYKVLMDNIDVLREQLRQLLETRTKTRARSYGSLYNANTPDRASFLMPNGSSFSRRTSIMSSSPVTSKM